MNTDRTAVHVKDRILQLLNNSTDTIKTVKSVLFLLDMTQGFWVESDYAFKAKEIAKRLKDMLIDAIDEKTHYKRVKVIDDLISQCSQMEDRFYVLEHRGRSDSRQIQHLVGVAGE